MTFLFPLFDKGVSLFLENPSWQIVGFIAMFIIFYAFSVKDDTKLVKLMSISCVFWILHFFLMGNFWALIATSVGLLRLLLSLKYKGNMKVLLFIAILSLILGYMSYEGFISLIPICATLIASYAFFFLEKIPLRLLLQVTSLMWLYYHLQTWSISGVINEIVVQWTLILTIYRFIYAKERYSYDIESWAISIKRKFLQRFRKLPPIPRRLNFGRFIFLRDSDRFETSE